MKICNAFFKVGVLCAICVAACDLQPRIASIPDSIGMFIQDRYPALLADPESQPEIYNSAVTDYGVYASPELYGSTNVDDYVLYAGLDDYVLVPESPEEQPDSKELSSGVVISSVDISDDVKVGTADENDYLIVPTYGNDKMSSEFDTIVVKEKVDVAPDIETKPAPQSETKVQQKTETKATVKPETKSEEKIGDEIVVVRGDTVYSLARKNNMTMAEFAEINNLQEPYKLSVGQKLTARRSSVKSVKKDVPNVISVEKVQEIKSTRVSESKKDEIKPNNTKRVDLTEITVERGDTLYSISRKYEIPVNDLAVMNKISAPFALSVGQKIRVPKLDTVETRSATQIKAIRSSSSDTKKTDTKNVKQTDIKKDVKKDVKQESKTVTKDTAKKTGSAAASSSKQSAPEKKQNVDKTASNQKSKISSDPKKQLPKISPRSASKFSWPLRGKVLSGYGPKKGGLVNEGINIAGTTGAAVRAAENGVVAYAGNEVKGMGNLIIIQHSDGWMTIYAHLNSMNVRRGAKVHVGDKIGTVGQTGKVDKPQLHFEIRRGTKSYNPTQYLKK